MRIIHYDVEVSFDLPPAGLSPYAPGILRALTALHIENDSGESCSAITLLLYRLFKVHAVTVDGRSAELLQEIRSIKDMEYWHVNTITILLSCPLEPGEECSIALEYQGPVAGAREVAPYIFDTVSREYTLLRLDSLWYPVTRFPGRQLPDEFTYTLALEVPSGYVAVAPGECRSHGNTYSFRCNKSRWRLDLAVAKFDCVSLEELSIYHLPGFEDWSKRALSWIVGALEGMTWRLGKQDVEKLDVVQIPKWWGSQSSPGFILQEARGDYQWTDAADIIHEVCHFWTKEPADWPNRFADESLAHYFQVVILSDTLGEEIAKRNLDFYHQVLVKTPAVQHIGLLQGGNLEKGLLLETLTRCKGPLALHDLQRILGEEAFWRLMRQYIQGGTGSVNAFVALLQEQHPGPVTEGYLNRWYY